MFVIVIGGGQTGSYLGRLLLAHGHQVRVIEVRPEVIAKLHQELPAEVIVQGDGADPKVLTSARARSADVMAVVTGSDEDNLVVSSIARFEFGVRRVIARINNVKNAWLFTPEMGVDVAINQADLLTHLIIEEMSLGDMMTLLKLRLGQYSLVEEKVHPASAVAGAAIRDLNLPADCILVAVIREGQLILPRGNTVLQPADEVLAIVHPSQANRLDELLGEAERKGDDGRESGSKNADSPS